MTKTPCEANTFQQPKSVPIRVKLKIRHKLFSTLLLTSLVVAAVLFLFLQWNFDRGFINYVNKQEIKELDLLAELLSKEYGSHGNWLFMVDNYELWIQLHSIITGESLPFPLSQKRRGKQLGSPPSHNGPKPHHREVEHPPPKGGSFLGPRILLVNVEKEKIIGEPIQDSKNITFRPIVYKTETVGYLGVVPVEELSEAGDLLFVEQQTVSFAVVTAVMVIFSFLVSFLVTSHLIRPINELIEGTRKLIGGWFSTRIPVTTRDELGTLSEHFNNLANTLEENEKARQLWVADISHELRTPLAILLGEVEAMQDGIQKTDAQSLAGLHGEILHMGRLVNDLYELSMTDIGALNYKKINVDICQTLMETVDLFEQRYLKKGLQLSVVPQNLPPVTLLADPDRMQQLFTNVLENSLRYTSSPGEVEIRVSMTAETISFQIMDSEPGISPVQLPRIFDRLFRADASRNRKSGGAGLGMSICKNIIEAHQGYIDAADSPLGGLQITIRLPRAT